MSLLTFQKHAGLKDTNFVNHLPVLLQLFPSEIFQNITLQLILLSVIVDFGRTGNKMVAVSRGSVFLVMWQIFSSLHALHNLPEQPVGPV